MVDIGFQQFSEGETNIEQPTRAMNSLARIIYTKNMGIIFSLLIIRNMRKARFSLCAIKSVRGTRDESCAA